MFDFEQAEMTCQQPAKALFAFHKRQLPKILPIQHQQIENIVDQGPTLWPSIDQPFKAGVAVFVQRHDFTVEDCRTLSIQPEPLQSVGIRFLKSFWLRL